MLREWRQCNIGDKLIYHWNDFDGSGSLAGIVTEKQPDHCIVTVGGMHLWLDDRTLDMFSRNGRGKRNG